MCEFSDPNSKNEFTYKNRLFDKYTTPEILDEVCKFNFFPTDIVLATFPRSGTIFTQEIVWQIKNEKSSAENENVKHKFQFIELNHKSRNGIINDAFEVLQLQIENPYRLIRTHLPYEFIKDNLEKSNSKLIVVMRNAKDCLVSNFHFQSNNSSKSFSGTFDEFFHLFTQGSTTSGSYFDNNLEWWALKNRDNVLILFYEDLLTNLSENVEKIANFLGNKLTSEAIEKIVRNCSFSSMYNDSSINLNLKNNCKLLRKGIIGDWKNHLSEEQNNILNEIIENKFKNVDLKFVYD